MATGSKLKSHIFLRDPESGELVSFGPQSANLPKWAKDKIAGKTHLFENPEDATGVVELPSRPDNDGVDYKQGQPTGKEPASTELGKSELGKTDEDADGDGDEDDTSKPPPKNASEVVWRRYAENNGVPVTEKMGRDDIIKECDEAGLLD